MPPPPCTSQAINNLQGTRHQLTASILTVPLGGESVSACATAWIRVGLPIVRMPSWRAISAEIAFARSNARAVTVTRSFCSGRTV